MLNRHERFVFNLESVAMDSVQVGKAVFVRKKSYTTLGIEPRTYSYPGRSVNHPSVCWVKKTNKKNIYSSSFGGHVLYSYFFWKNHPLCREVRVQLARSHQRQRWHNRCYWWDFDAPKEYAADQILLLTTRGIHVLYCLSKFIFMFSVEWIWIKN